MVTKKVDETPDPWEDKPTVEAAKDRDFLTVTIKAGAGFEVPWLVFHTNSVDEALTALQHGNLDELMDLAARKGKEFAKAFGGSQSFAKPAAAPAAGGWSKPAEQAVSVPAGAVKDKVCVHGDAVPKSGGGGNTGKRAWSGYFCPNTDRNNQCVPEFNR